jgi:hypothetical protein
MTNNNILNSMIENIINKQRCSINEDIKFEQNIQDTVNNSNITIYFQ